VIDKQPGGKWNYDRIFPRDTVTRTGPRKTGWGTWIRFSDVTVVAGRSHRARAMGARSHTSAAEQRDAVVARSGLRERLKILQVAKGYQKEFELSRIDGCFRSSASRIRPTRPC
jgi:hypothetical protein